MGEGKIMFGSSSNQNLIKDNKNRMSPMLRTCLYINTASQAESNLNLNTNSSRENGFIP